MGSGCKEVRQEEEDTKIVIVPSSDSVDGDMDECNLKMYFCLS